MAEIDTQRVIDAAAWDAAVAASGGHLLQTWAWGELKSRFGWSAARLAVGQAGAQVLFRAAGPVTVAYVPRGPFGCDGDPLRWASVLAAVHAESRRRRAIFLKVEPALPDDANSRALLRRLGLGESGQRVQPASTIVVDLTAAPAEMLARMKPKWRYNIGLAARRGVTVRAGGLDDVPAWYDLMVATGRRDGFAVHSEEYYRQFLWLMGPMARLLLAEHEGALLGGIVATAFAGQGIYMYGASADEGRNLMPNHLLQWEAMQWARQAGCATYDLWGIPDEAGRAAGEANGEGDDGTAALTGVYRFKGGFGGRVARSAGAWDRVYSPPLYWLYERVLGWVRGHRRARDRAGEPQIAPIGADS